MTRQEIFDTVATHLITQGRRAWTGTNCMYLAPNGDRCAIGCLIPDDLYTPEMEGSGVDCFYDREDADGQAIDAFIGTLERLGIDENDDVTRNLLVGLQSVHDRDTNWPDPRPALRDVAGKFGLEARF